MAGELQIPLDKSALVLYVELRDVNAQIADVADDEAFEVYNAGAKANYVIPLTEQGASAYYVGDMPAWVGAGLYYLTVYEQAGEAPAEGDLARGHDLMHWAGAAPIPLNAVKLAPDGIDAISTAEPAGIAANFREKLLQGGWMRWFRPHKINTNDNTLKTLAADGETVITTQSATTVAGVQTLGNAE